MPDDPVLRQQQEDANEDLVSIDIRLQPEYVELIRKACIDLRLTKRELLEECLKRSLGDPSGIFDDE